MIIPSFNEFLNSIEQPNKKCNNKIQEKTQTDKLVDMLAQNISILCLNLLECYHNWLKEELNSNN